MDHMFISEIQYLAGLTMSKSFFIIIPSYDTTGIIQLTVFSEILTSLNTGLAIH